MAMIRVTAARLKEVAENLKNLNTQFQTKTQELTGQEQALSAMWDGQAKDAFHSAFLRDSEQMEAFHQLIERYIQTLLEIAVRYEQAEAKNTEIASTRTY